jgi:uncharacterized membrane protein YtjA (UPF0391 family)
MVKAGIVLIAVAVVFLPLAVVAAIFGFGGLADDVFLVGKLLGPVLLVVGIVLLVVGLNRRRVRAVH